MRIDKILANSGYGTRSQVKDFLRSGRVTINGEAILDPGYSVFDKDIPLICLDGSPIVAGTHLYFCLNKPDGYVTAMTDDHLPCVGDLIPDHLKTKKLAPVGRLDYHTTGVLLITNDGDLSHKLTSPKWHKEKVYLVTYEGEALTEKEVECFSKGITLHEKGREPEKLKPAELILLAPGQCRLVLIEGKTHQVKRMLASQGRSVIALHRESIGSLCLHDGQKPGEMYALSAEEIALLKE